MCLLGADASLYLSDSTPLTILIDSSTTVILSLVMSNFFHKCKGWFSAVSATFPTTETSNFKFLAYSSPPFPFCR